MPRNLKPLPIESAKDFIDETERKIINEELPIMVRYLADLEYLLQQSQDRSHREMETRDKYLIEIRRLTCHIATRVHQLINIPAIRRLFEEHEKLEEMDSTLASIMANGKEEECHD